MPFQAGSKALIQKSQISPEASAHQAGDALLVWHPGDHCLSDVLIVATECWKFTEPSTDLLFVSLIGGAWVQITSVWTQHFIIWHMCALYNPVDYKYESYFWLKAYLIRLASPGSVNRISWIFGVLLLLSVWSLSSIAVNARTTFTFTYSPCDWIKWKAAANKHWEDILVTDSKQHCTISLAHCSIDKALHCFVTVGAFVSVKNWWSSSSAGHIFKGYFHFLLQIWKSKFHTQNETQRVNFEF